MGFHERVGAFTTAADQTGPTWEILARKIGAPILAGVLIGLALVGIILILPSTAGWILIIAVLVAAFTWTIRQLIWVRRVQREMKAEIAALERLQEPPR